MVSLLFSIHGRVSRGPFWLVFLILLPVISALILLIDTSLNDNPVLMLMALVLYAWIAICITVKRLHDMDATGWLSIPVVLIPIAVILVGSFPGTVGPNQFGPDPLQRKALSKGDAPSDREASFPPAPRAATVSQSHRWLDLPGTRYALSPCLVK